MKEYVGKILKENRFTIPKEIMKVLNLKEGDFLIIKVDDYTKIILRKGEVVEKWNHNG